MEQNLIGGVWMNDLENGDFILSDLAKQKSLNDMLGTLYNIQSGKFDQDGEIPGFRHYWTMISTIRCEDNTVFYIARYYDKSYNQYSGEVSWCTRELDLDQSRRFSGKTQLYQGRPF